jgi:glycosyltransferase involved in cell wall biosynthesis
LRAVTSGLAALLPDSDFVHLHLVRDWRPSLRAVWDACGRTAEAVGVTFQDYAPEICRASSPEVSLLRSILRRCRWVSVLSRFSRRRLMRDFPEITSRLHVIPNGCDRDNVLGAAAGLDESSFILSVARLTPYKGIDLMLMAWKDVCGRMPGTQLVVCGADHEQGRYQRLAKSLGIKSRVRFLGKIDHARTRHLMRSCLFFVLPSRDESFGMAALEAMSDGKAVLASRTGPADFIKHRVSGLLFPAGNLAALRRNLLELLDDRLFRERLGRRAREATRYFTWDSAARSYLQLMSAS